MLDDFRGTQLTWDTANESFFQKIEASQGDEQGRRLSVQILNGGQVVPNAGTLALAWATPNKEHYGIDNFATVDSNNSMYEIAYKTGMLQHTGKLDVGLVLFTSNGRIESKPFTIHVYGSVVTDYDIQTSDSFSLLTEALDKIESYYANWNDYQTAMDSDFANLQADFNQAVGAVTVDSEVVLARVDVTGTTHAVLNERLDNMEVNAVDKDTDTGYRLSLEIVDGLPRLKIEEAI